MTRSATVEEIAGSPALYPVARAGSQVRLLRLSEADYRQASFLDERLVSPTRDVIEVAWPRLQAAASSSPRRAHYIFHIGHVGSTLLSRLLGEHEALFCLREPALLRPLAGVEPGAERDRDLDALLRLCSRTWRPAQTALIKTTSFVGELAELLLAQSPDALALVLGVSPPSYLRTTLGGSQSRLEIEALAAARRGRLARRLGGHVRIEREGEWIAMTWLCETLAQQAAATRHRPRVMAVDFDRFLTGPAAQLGAALDHFGAEAGQGFAQAVSQGPLMRRYAKAPEHAYDADLRRRVLDQAERAHGAEVRAGMDWLQAMAQAYPAAMTALRQAARLARPVVAPPPAR